MEFSEEQMEKAKACKTFDEFKETVKAEGFDLSEEEAKNYFSAIRWGELSEDDLDKVSGGKNGWKKTNGFSCDTHCPFCFYYFTYKHDYYQKGELIKIESSPNTCKCGASIYVNSFNQVAVFDKDGRTEMASTNCFKFYDVKK